MIFAVFATATPWVLSGIILRVLAKTTAQKAFRTKLLILPSLAIPVLLVGYYLGGLVAYYGWDTLVRMLRS
jgi:hypothetical protein